MTFSLLTSAIQKLRIRRMLPLALPIIHGLCLAAPALAIGAYAPGYEPDQQLLQMTDVVTVPDPNASRNEPFYGIGLSGSPGNKSVFVGIGKNVDLPNPIKYYAVNGISILEKSDNPCQITLWGKMVDPRYPSFGRKLAVFELDKCAKANPLSTWLDWKSVNFRTAEGKFIRSVRVCGGKRSYGRQLTSLLGQTARPSNAWEIKGLMILPGLVLPGQEEIIPQMDPQTFIRPTCLGDEIAAAWGPGWSGWSSCPDNQLVTGVHVHFMQDIYFTGLTVRCKSVRSFKPISDPVTDSEGY